MGYFRVTSVCLMAAVFLFLLPFSAQAQDFAIEGPVAAEWSELISASVGAGNAGVQRLRDGPGANRVVASGDGTVVYSFVNGSVNYASMRLQARNGETGEILWQVTPCPEVDWHNFNVCVIDDIALTDNGETLIVAGRKEVSTESDVTSNRDDRAWVAAFDSATGSLDWQSTTDFGGLLVEPGLRTSYIDLSDNQVLLASSIRIKHVSGYILIGAFAAMDLLTGAEQWNARVGTNFIDEFTPKDAALSFDKTTWYISGVADAEVWPCDAEGVCGPHPTIKDYTNAFGLVAIDVATGVLTDLSERSMPENEYRDAKSYGLTLSDDGQYLYQVGTAEFIENHPDWEGWFFSSRLVIRLASATGNHVVVHQSVHETFPASVFVFGGDPPNFDEEFNSCGHGQVEAGAGQLYWHFECSNSQTGAQGTVLSALDRDTWTQSWQSVQYSDQEWADDLAVLSDGKVLASGGTWDEATEQLNGFIRALDSENGEQVFRAQFQAFEDPVHAGEERIHDIASGGEQVFGRVSMGNSSFDHYQMIALGSLDVANNDEFHLRCFHEPLWPQAGDTVTIAMAPKRFPLDGNPYPVDRREIWLDVSSQPIASNEGTPPYVLSYETGPLTAGQFTYGCRAIQGDNSVFSGWRTVSVGAPGPSQAIPVSFTGPSSDRIDIVLVADTDTYSGPDDPEFLEHAGSMFTYFFEHDSYSRFQHLFNFWIAQTTGDADVYIGEEEETIRTIVQPHDWDTNYAFADVGVIVHADDFRDFAKGGWFTIERGGSGTARHEAGHRPFGLADEYCCDGGYWEAPIFPNVYETLESCEDDGPNLGRTTPVCRSWVSESDDITYYTSEPASDDLMNDSKKANAADIRRIEWLLEKCLEGEC